MNARSITGAEFPVAIQDGIVLVDFWATWCAPCRAFSPIFERSSEAHPHVHYLKLDTEQEPDLASALQIHSIPTLMAFRDGVLVFRHAGLVSEEGLSSLVAQLGGLDMAAVNAQLGDEDSGGE